MNDFAAIDLETANGERSSVCSVGVVVVLQPESLRADMHGEIQEIMSKYL